MTIAIIRGEKALNELISKTIATGQTYREQLFQASLSAVVHLLEYGQPGPLNLLFKSLTSNDSGAFKNWLRRLNLYVGLGIDGIDTVTDKDGKRRLTGMQVVDKMTAREISTLDIEIRNAYIDQNAVIGYKDKSFTVMSVKGDPRAKEKRLLAVDFIEKRFADWDLEKSEDYQSKYLPWRERNNFAEVRVVGDAVVFEKIKQVRDTIGLNPNRKPNKDRVQLDVSAKAKRIVQQAYDDLESLVKQELDHGRPVSKDEQIVAAAEVAREHKRERAEKATEQATTH